MVEEKKSFVLYEYLLYFWKKKWYFLIVPLITTILVVGAVYALKHTHNQYTGTSWVFTGSVTAKELTDPDNLKETYKKFNTLKDITVTEKGQVKFTVQGNTKEQVQKDLDKITNSFYKKLQNNANSRIDLTEAAVKELENNIKFDKKNISIYRNKMSQNPNTMTAIDFGNSLTLAEGNITDAQSKIIQMKGDLVLFEKPKLLSKTVGPSKSYIPEGIAVGIILGILCTIGLLMFMKYIEEARRYYKR